MTERDRVLSALDAGGVIASGLSQLGGPLGVGAAVIAKILKMSAHSMRHKGASVDDIIASIKEPRKLNMPWPTKAPAELQKEWDTEAGTPSALAAKKREEE